MDKKKIWKTIRTILICILLFIIGKFCACILTIGYNPYGNIETESDASVIFVRDGYYLYKGEEEIASLDFPYEKLFVKDGTVYYVEDVYNSETRTHTWCLRSYNYETYIEKTCAVLDNRYEYKLEDGYGRRCAYFDETEIILNAEEKVLVYNLETGITQEFTHEEYKLPEIQVEAIDNDEILICIDGNEKIWTLDEMAKTSEGIAELCTYRNKKVNSYLKYLDSFFDMLRVNIIEDKIYVQGETYNSIGERVFILLEYDIEQEVWRYVESAIAEGDYFIYNFE